jgi:hypothetical protein
MKTARRDLVLSAALFLALIAPPWLWAGEIHDAARDGKLDKVKSLLEADASLVSAKAKGDWTPLHYAALNCQKAVVEFLLTKGADPGAKAESGDAPLHCAVMGSNLLRDKGAVELLLAKGADVNARNKEGETPLTFAGKEVAELLLKAKADINAKNKVGRTKLHREVVNGDKDMVAFLLSKDADASVEDKNGISALDLAVLDVKIDIAAMLRKHLLAAAAAGIKEGDDKDVVLRYKFAKGDSFKYLVDRDMIILTDNPAAPRQESLATQRLRVDVVSEGEAYRLANVIETVRMLMTPGNLRFDSENKEDRAQVPKGSVFEAMLAVLDTPVFLDMKPTGEVVSYDLDPFKEKLRKIGRLDCLDTVKDSAEKLAEGVLVVLPPKALSKGQRWTLNTTEHVAGIGRVKAEHTFTLEGVVKTGGDRRAWISVSGTATLQPDPDLKEPPRMVKFANTGDILFSTDRGRLVSVKQGWVMALEIPGPKTRKATVVVYIRIGETQ